MNGVILDAFRSLTLTRLNAQVFEHDQMTAPTMMPSLRTPEAISMRVGVHPRDFERAQRTMANKALHEWTVLDVVAWLCMLGANYETYALAALKQNISGSVIVSWRVLGEHGISVLELCLGVTRQVHSQRIRCEMNRFIVD